MKHNSSNQLKTECLIVLFAFFTITILAQNKGIKVACIGNSITYGHGAKDPLKDSYPNVLQSLLGNQYEVRNFGSSGATALRNSDNSYWKTPSYENVKQYCPDIVIIKLGTNDSKIQNKQHWNEFETDLSNMIDTLRSLSSTPKIFLCSPVPALNNGNFGITDSVMTKVIIPQIKKVALYKKTEFIDLHKAFEKLEVNFPDNIHPNESGLILIAKEVSKALSGKVSEYIPEAFPGRKTDWYGCNAPVCNIKSWPGRKNKELWNEFLTEWNITDIQADTIKCSPVDQAILLAKTRIPILGVCGDSDRVVPFSENSVLLRERMVAVGGSMTIITKPGVDHHPHSLTDPTPIVDFVIQHQSGVEK